MPTSRLYNVKVKSKQYNFRLPKKPGEQQKFTNEWTFQALGEGENEHQRQNSAMRKVLKQLWPYKFLAEKFLESVDCWAVDLDVAARNRKELVPRSYLN